MKIVIVGCGKIGKSLIASLVTEGHEVVVIDKKQEKVADAINIYDVIGVCGIGTDSVTLTEAGVDKADIFIAVTGSDELNMLSCYIAKTLGAENTVARIRDRAYNENSLGFLQQKLNLSMSINPERFAAEDIYNVLKVPGAAHIETFSTRNFEIIELLLKEDSTLHNVKVMDLRKQYKANFLICAVQRGEEVFIPDGNFVLQSGDKIALTAPPTEILKLLRSLKITRKQARNVMILGGSRTAYYLAKMLLNSGNSVTIIDKDPVRCRELDEALPGATIIHGDGAQQEVLLEEGLKNMDAFISLTGMDEENILISYYAASQNVPKVITKVNRSEFVAVAGRMGLDTLVSPRRTITDVIVRYARALQNTVGNNVEKLYKIMDGNAEALMFNVNSDFEYIDIPLKNISFKKNLLIAGILRNRKASVPTGNDVIMAGDKVVVISTDHILYDLADIIA
ncbi:MAG: Trk system potassium transporter TrkA [Ruminococcaceae bacterium]|nr:Trk system potassium transporter TrkA [Oscillospiraceae bacterium]